MQYRILVNGAFLGKPFAKRADAEAFALAEAGSDQAELQIEHWPDEGKAFIATSEYDWQLRIWTIPSLNG